MADAISLKRMGSVKAMTLAMGGHAGDFMHLYTDNRRDSTARGLEALDQAALLAGPSNHHLAKRLTGLSPACLSG